jgi:polar amino acid transport system substrate-binding protein
MKAILKKFLYFSPSRKTSYFLLVALGICALLLLTNCSSYSLMNTVYTIGQDSRWPQIQVMGKERNFTAFSNSLLNAVAKEEHFRIRMVVAPAADLVVDLENKKLQGILTTLQPDSIYNHLLFSEPYFLLGPVLVISSLAEKKGQNEFAKKIIAVQSNAIHLPNLEKDPSIQIKLYSDILQALADLHDKKIDGAIIPAIPAHIYTSTFYAGELKIATDPLTDEGVRLVTLKNPAGEELIEKFNRGLALLEQNQMYQQLIEEWDLINVKKNYSY